MGLPEREFWGSSLRGFQRQHEAWLWRERQAARRDIALAWRMEALARTKRLPSLKSLLSSIPTEERKPMTPEEAQRHRRELKRLAGAVKRPLLSERKRHERSRQDR